MANDKFFFKTAEGDATRTKKLNYLLGSVADNQGRDGDTIDHTVRAIGDGSQGTTDTYAMFGDVAETNLLGTFTVYNGADGQVFSVNGRTGDVIIDSTEVETLYEANADTNKYTDAEKTKLGLLEPSVTSDTLYIAGNGLSADPLTFSQDMKDVLKLYVGTSMQEVAGTVVSDGTTITVSVEAFGGGDVRYVIEDGINTLDCTPPATTTLTAGTDSLPILNYIYIDASTNLLTSSTTGFIATTYVPLAQVLVGSASFVQVSGTYKTHKWSDHIFQTGDNGHISHVNAWIREQNATWVSGNALSHTGSGTPTVNIGVSSGTMFQLHKHLTEAKLSPTTFYIENDEVTKYRATSNIASILTDSLGGLTNNKYMSLVFWYAHSQIPGDSKVYVTKPSGSYSSESDARADALKYTNFSIPSDFKGTAILLHRLIVRNSSGTLTVFDGAGDDLRGTLPNTASGSSTSVSSTFLDSTFSVENLADTTKQFAVDVSGVTTATTRVVTIQDQDGTMALMSDIALIGTFAEFTTNYEGEL